MKKLMLEEKTAQTEAMRNLIYDVMSLYTAHAETFFTSPQQAL